MVRSRLVIILARAVPAVTLSPLWTKTSLMTPVIYRDEDKGVAKGYENENIFLSEFCGEDHNWQCLVLVREGKGQPWRVIYCGNDYTEET